MRIRSFMAALVVAALAFGPGLVPARAASGSTTIYGVSTPVYAENNVEDVVFARCKARQTGGASAATQPGATVIDLGSTRTGAFTASATIPASKLGPVLPIPPGGSYQLYNYDIDLHYANAACGYVGSTATQNPNEVSSPTISARYLIIAAAFNATGTPLTVNYTTP